MLQTASPSENRRNGVGAGFLTLLVLSVMACDGAVGGLCLDCLSVVVRADERTCLRQWKRGCTVKSEKK